MKSIVRFFSSVKLAIVLLIVITVASIMGTLIPQQRSTAEYAARYGQLANLLIRLEFTKLYHSWWFIGLLILFSLNIIICNLTRLPQKLRRIFRPHLDFVTKNVLVMKVHDRLVKNWSLDTTQERMRRELKSRRYRIKQKKREDKTFIIARKKMLGLLGSDIVHLGLLIILFGGIISGFGGFRTNLNISEGQTLQIPRADFKLRLDKFETEIYPNGGVKDWKSTLAVP